MLMNKRLTRKIKRISSSLQFTLLSWRTTHRVSTSCSNTCQNLNMEGLMYSKTFFHPWSILEPLLSLLNNRLSLLQLCKPTRAWELSEYFLKKLLQCILIQLSMLTMNTSGINLKRTFKKMEKWSMRMTIGKIGIASLYE